MHERRAFDGVGLEVARVRQWVAEVLDGWGVPQGDAILMISELATNAVLHARSTSTVDVERADGGSVRIGVSDSDTTPPVPEAAPADDSLHGRGLLLVTSLARQWGYDTTSDGKTVWFEV